MKFDWIKDEKVICFAAGVAVAIIGKKILKSEKTRNFCVTGLAKGMQLKEEAKETLKNMKEDAEDICYEAKMKMYSDAEEAEV